MVIGGALELRARGYNKLAAVHRAVHRATQRPGIVMRCPVCGLPYTRLRTGLCFADVVRLLWSPSDDATTWRYKRRNTVLGRWRQEKLRLWAEHLNACGAGFVDGEPFRGLVGYPP